MTTDPASFGSSFALEPWYLTAGPDGPYVYALASTERWTPVKAEQVTADLEVAVDHKVVGQRIVFFVTADAPLTEITVTGTPPTKVVGWKLRDPDEESARWPLTMPADAERDDEFLEHYTPISEPDGPAPTRVFDATTVRPLTAPGPLKPPELPAGLTWTPAPAHLALWGPVLPDHLAPGHLTGVQKLVVEKIDEHPWTTPWTSDYIYDHGKKIGVNFHRRFELEPVTVETVKVGRRKVTRRRYASVLETVRDIPAPRDVVAGLTLADALEKLPAVIDAEYARIMPAEGHVCAHCAGHGIIVP